MSIHKPIRNSELEIHTVADGYIVYDKEADRVHYLNQTASLILELCNGEHGPAEIFQLVQDAFELDQPPAEEAQQVLEQFREEGLTQ